MSQRHGVVSVDEYPERVELCARNREGVPCLGVLYRPQPGVAYCRRCGATDGAAVVYVRERDREGCVVQTFKRICIEDYTVLAANGDRLDLKRGREYITSVDRAGEVTVFSTFWVRVPVLLFAGARAFTL